MLFFQRSTGIVFLIVKVALNFFFLLFLTSIVSYGQVQNIHDQPSFIIEYEEYDEKIGDSLSKKTSSSINNEVASLPATRHITRISREMRTSVACDSKDSINVAVCGSYITPSNKIWTSSRVENDTIPNAAGCDSIITILSLIHI